MKSLDQGPARARRRARRARGHGSARRGGALARQRRARHRPVRQRRRRRSDAAARQPPEPSGRTAQGRQPITPVGVPNTFADLAERVSPGVVNISTKKTVVAHSLEDFFPFPFQDPFGGGRAPADRAQAAGAEPRHRLRDLAGRLHRHQQPRDRGRRQHHGALHGRQRAAGRDRRARSEDRHRADPREDRQAALRAAARRLRVRAARRVGGGDRQSRSGSSTR